MIILTPFCTAPKLENRFLLKPDTKTVGILTFLNTSSVLRATICKIPCGVPCNTLFPAALIYIGGSIFVYSSILDSTPRINSEPINCLDDPESTKS